jgi:hypothetical protein
MITNDYKWLQMITHVYLMITNVPMIANDY